MVAQSMEYNGIDIQKAMEKPMEVAKEYPVATMLVLFGVGLGVGALLSQACATAMTHEPSMSERLSKQIYEAVTNAMPDAVRRQLHV